MPDPVQASGFDLRPDGSVKGLGFLGAFALPDGRMASEFSIADSEQLKDAKGNYLDYPSLVPTLTRDEVKAVLRSAADPQVKLPQSVYDKAEAFALFRKSQGLPLFARPGEQLALYPDIKRVAVQMRSGDVALPNESGQRDVRLGPLGYDMRGR